MSGDTYPTKDELREAFDYCDGILVWRNPLSRRCKKGDVAGTLHPSGRTKKSFKGVDFFRHRLVWRYFHSGPMPKHIDHVDRDKNNDCIENLRPCTSQENNMNRGLTRKNSSGFKGVCWDKKSKKWQAWLGGRYLGSSDVAREAAKVYDSAVVGAFQEFAVTNASMGLLEG